jgi:hypothetical protein
MCLDELLEKSRVDKINEQYVKKANAPKYDAELKD